MNAGGRLPLYDVPFVVVDTETTGGSPATAALTEIAAVRYRSGEVEGTLQTLVNPGTAIPPFISGLTGITDSMVADAPPVARVLPSLLEFLGGAVVVGHNVRFDLGFLDAALADTGRDPLGNPVVDTLSLSRRLVREDVTDCRLGTLAAELRLPHQPSHRALDDVLATGDLLHRLLEDAATYGVEDLAELVGFSRAMGALRLHPGLVGPAATDLCRRGTGSAPTRLLPARPVHPLRSTARLPRTPGAYWYSDGTGRILSVGWGHDLRAAARGPFFGEPDRRTRKLVRRARRMDAMTLHSAAEARFEASRLAAAWRPLLAAETSAA